MLEITRPRCEYLVDPVGLDEPRPRLSWEVEQGAPERRGARQAAWRVVVRRDSGPRVARKVAWDSGKVASGRSAQIAYDGKPLEPCAAYTWRVRAWDDRGHVSAWSPEARFTMGPAGSGPLAFPRACWIGQRLPATWNEREGPPSPCLRRRFTVDRPVRRAVLFASALGVYEARINGSRVGANVLAPEWTDYRRKVQYQGYDVTGMIREGENVVAALLGPGWYAGQIGLGSMFVGLTRGYYGRTLRFAAFLLLEDEEGGTTVVTSDREWKVTTEGPVRTSDLLSGETIDARREMPGWDAPGFDDAAWETVHAMHGPTMVAQPNEPITITQDIAAVSVSEPAPGSWVFDMGQNMVGWVRLTLRAPAGTDVRLRHAEVLNPDGTIYRDNLRLDPADPLWGARQEDHYVARGDGEEVFEPHFTYHGFRYVEVTGLPSAPSPWTMVGRVFHSSSPEAGTFECSAPELNRVMSAIQWTQRANMMSIPTDCPQRDERLGWAGDILAFGPAAAYNRDMAGFLAKWLRDMREAQSDDGQFPDYAPHPFDPNARFRGNPGWADAAVILPWMLWETYGDQRAVAEAFESARRWVDWSVRTYPDLVWRPRPEMNVGCFGDWLNADTFVDIPGVPTKGGEVPKEVFSTAIFARSAEHVGRMAALLGMEDEAAHYASLARRIRAAFVKTFVSRDARILGDTQAGYALALHYDLLPPAMRKRAAERLVAAFAPYGGAPSTGFISTVPMMRELVRRGYVDEAYRVLTRRDMPSWIYMVEHGGTTIWERWDGYVEGRGYQNPGMNSFNHWAIGSVGEWMWRVIGGINLDPGSPGAGSVTISPVPGGGIGWARAAHRTIRGLVSAAWKIDDGTLSLDVSIPPGMTATVVVPGAGAADVTECDLPLARVEGVKVLGRRQGGVAVSVVSGSYHFVAKPRGRTARS